MKSQACYELVWSDEFNNNGLPDSTNWYYETGASGWGNHELQYYTEKRTENARVENGTLIIEAREESYGGSNYTSARLITYPQNRYWKYGKIEACMKLPYGQGIWPAFWMMGRSFFEGTGWPACGETDIMELIGGGEGRDDKAYGTIHWSDAGGQHAQYGGSYQLPEGIFADTFHVFAVEWNPSSIRWLIDGSQFAIVDITPAHMTEFHQEFFLILNLAVGGNWPGYPDATTIFPQKLEVDYIRVYQLDTKPKIEGDSLAVKGCKNLNFSTFESDSFTYNWTVPDDAVIVSGQGTNNINVDWGCDTDTVFCNLITDCEEYDLQHIVRIDSITIHGDEVINAYDSGLVYRVPETRNAVYEWSLPGGVTLKSPADSNRINVNWNNSDGLLKVNVNDLCGADSAELLVLINRQLPYPDKNVKHIIPGTIESVHFDSGGEGIAYHDSDEGNQGTGIRQDEDVDTDYNDGGGNVGWIITGEWLEYSVEVSSPNTYDAEIRVASPNSTGKMKILFNGVDKTGSITIPGTGSWTAFESILVRDIELSEYDTLMRIEIESGIFNLGRLNFADSLASVIDQVMTDDIQIYPVPVSDKLFFTNLHEHHDYTLLDAMGKVICCGTTGPEGYVDIYELSGGMYIIMISKNEFQKKFKFLKILQ